ncbi:hypothetical protein EHS25_006170 [Saitozyma podzolica]|uniref:C2H2-type domain-containing protein n=1 Tax=Saitozyma podzolica TaxID=1890683 RepID=A0A427XRX0_9TREE|nr:hypothetical protein EHS25_006170 [Saitozyma podzolica]
MAGDEEDGDDDVYGELGGRHPLRRVDEGKEDSGVSLPGIKALFGVADHPPTPATSSHPPGPLFSTPSLPSLVPTSPSSSPSTARTSRYSSFNSSISTTVSDLPPQPPQGGWWAPDFERGERSSADRGSSDRSSSSLPHPPPAQRGHSFPLGQLPWMDEHDNKRRRSDQPRSAYDAEEAARLRWQAQSRNASFPVSGSMSAGSGVGLRGLLHPHSAASAAMSRGSVSASGGMTPISPVVETRRPSAAPRSASVVGGQLAQSFADLSARDRNSPMMEMPPPSLHGQPPDRRSSMFPLEDARSMPGPLPHMSMTPPPPQPIGESASMSAMSSATSRPPSTGPEPLRRGSLTRPPTPEPPRSVPRRSSLTEIIRAKSGDVDTLATLRSREAIAMDKSSLSEPGGLAPWPARRESAESIKSAPGISLNSDGEGGGAGGAASMRGRKRPSDDRSHLDEDVEMAGDPGMRGMEVLAESARRVAEEERKTVGSEEREGSPGKGPGPKYTCAYCAKTFSRPSSLRIHTYSHTGERPFVCKEPSCRRRFSVQSNLKRHAKVHQLGAQGHVGGPPIHQMGGPPPPHSMPPHPGHPAHPGHLGQPGLPGPPIRHGLPPPHPGFYPPPPRSGYGQAPYHPYDHPGRYPPQGGPHMGPPGYPGQQGPPRMHPGQDYPQQHGQSHPHDQGPGRRRGPGEEEWSEEELDEEDELDEDE